MLALYSKMNNIAVYILLLECSIRVFTMRALTYLILYVQFSTASFLRATNFTIGLKGSLRKQFS